MNEQEKQWYAELNALAAQYGGATNIPMEIFTELSSRSPESVRRAQQDMLAGKQSSAQGLSSDVAGFLSQAANLGISLNQLSKSKELGRNVVPPSLPTSLQANPQLSQALYDAQRGVASQANVLAPAQQEIQSAYNAQLEAARQGSGGQAGAFNAMANLANVQRMQAANQLVPMAQQVKLQNQDVYNNLLAQKQREREAINQSQMGVAGMAFDQYGQDAAAVAGMRGNALGNVAQSLGTIGQAASNLTPYFVGMDDESKAYAERTYNNVASNLQNRITPQDLQYQRLRQQPNFNPNAFSAQRYGNK